MTIKIKKHTDSLFVMISKMSIYFLSFHKIRSGHNTERLDF